MPSPARGSPFHSLGVSVQFLADLDSLRDFFGAEPKLEYPRRGYEDNCVTFELELGDNRVWFQFMPSQGWGELRLGGTPFRMEADVFEHDASRGAKDQGVSLSIDQVFGSAFE